MGSSKQQTTSQGATTSQTAPWKPTQPLLTDILGQVQPLASASGVSPQQSEALSALNSSISGLPNFGNAVTGLTNSYLAGDPTGLLNPALASYESAISPIANAPLDPNDNPYTRAALDTVQQDVKNSVNGMFAGAGRDLSGLNSQYLARGLAQGEAPILLNQYNQNVANRENAASGLLGASGSTASAISGNQAQGVNYAGQQPNLALGPAQYGISAANLAYGQPYQNLAQPLALTLPIAGLGSQSSGTSYNASTGTYTPSPGQYAASFLGGGSSSPAAGFLNIASPAVNGLLKFL